MKNFIAAGDSITVLVDDIAMGTPITAGTGQIIGGIFGVAANSTGPVDIDDGSSVVLNLTGIYDLPKAPSQAWTVGAKVYWDTTNYRCTSEAGSNPLIGIAVLAVGATAAETTGRVRLNGVAL
ncbi:Predicted phage recombinase, RecA/RadA family [Paracoccus thiocyanatus]|uniref:Predicted phage recombinase, RecA/RadA family n=2 Tax=Paracoccus thiocyanatus TaxID=34006 RepID=A0A1N6Y228_9RHOB|nr:Predicted phage recombinase, RecA/RadA family [Paracoccus thiocyanatus]